MSTGWSPATSVNLWARLLDGERTLKLIRRMFNSVAAIGTNLVDGGGLSATQLGSPSAVPVRRQNHH